LNFKRARVFLGLFGCSLGVAGLSLQRARVLLSLRSVTLRLLQL
jgi:hypothetical protein